MKPADLESRAQTWTTISGILLDQLKNYIFGPYSFFVVQLDICVFFSQISALFVEYFSFIW